MTISACSLMEESLEGDHLVLSCTLSNGNDTINAYSMIDCDAFRKAFIDSSFAQFHKIPLLPLHCNSVRSLASFALSWPK